MNNLLQPGLVGAKVVATKAFAELRDKVQITRDLAGTMVVAGPHGCGKRTALLTVLDELAVPCPLVDLNPGQSSKDIVRSVYTAVHASRDVFDLRSMQDELGETFVAAPGVLVVANAHMLTLQGAGQLHYLHARPGNSWAFVLLGGPGTAAAITREGLLRGDIVQAVEMHRLRGDELWQVVRGMHPLFATADQAMLGELDDGYCKGLPKEWARVLQVALQIQKRGQENGNDISIFDRKFAKAVVHQLPRLTKRSRGSE